MIARHATETPPELVPSPSEMEASTSAEFLHDGRNRPAKQMRSCSDRQ